MPRHTISGQGVFEVRLMIEVKSGCVVAVYADDAPADLEVSVVDWDIYYNASDAEEAYANTGYDQDVENGIPQYLIDLVDGVGG